MTPLLVPVPDAAELVPVEEPGVLLALRVPPEDQESGDVGVVVADRPLPGKPGAGQPVLAGLHSWLVRRTSAAGQVELVPTPCGPAVAAVDRLPSADGPVTTAQAVLPLGDRVLHVSAAAPGEQPARVAALVAGLLAGLREEEPAPVRTGSGAAPGRCTPAAGGRSSSPGR